MNIVLVHGFLSTSKIFFMMKKKFERKGFKCFAPTLKPIDAKFGLDDLAKKLKFEIEKHFGDESKFSLVGFSMGGVICRYYLQELNGLQRANKFISISAPHHGSYLAYLYPGRGIKQLRPNSEFIKNLKLNESSLQKISLYSFRTPFDLMIIPSTSSIWNIAINKKYFSLIHSYMLFNPKVIKDSINILLNSS